MQYLQLVGKSAWTSQLFIAGVSKLGLEYLRNSDVQKF
jgi:hypothetical protein